MTLVEFLVLLLWLLSPPWIIGIIILVGMKQWNESGGVKQTIQAITLLVLTSFCLSIAFLRLGPSNWGSVLGVHDAPVMWAPFAFLSVAFALPISLWRLRSKGAR